MTASAPSRRHAPRELLPFERHEERVFYASSNTFVLCVRSSGWIEGRTSNSAPCFRPLCRSARQCCSQTDFERTFDSVFALVTCGRGLNRGGFAGTQSTSCSPSLIQRRLEHTAAEPADYAVLPCQSQDRVDFAYTLHVVSVCNRTRMRPSFNRSTASKSGEPSSERSLI